MLNRAAISNLGTHVYGIAAIAFGIIGLIWGDFASVWQPIEALAIRRSSPRRIRISLCPLLSSWRPRHPVAADRRIGAVTLGILYLFCALFWLPRVIGFPKIVGTWLGLPSSSFWCWQR